MIQPTYKTTIVNGVRYSFAATPGPPAEATAASIRSSLLTSLQEHGLRFRLASHDDIVAISSLQQSIFGPAGVMAESLYELYRLIRFGYILLLEHPDRGLVAFYSTLSYQTRECDAYGVRVGVLPEFGGHNYAAHLAKLAMVMAIEKGSLVFNALMSPHNFKSASNVLNHVGYYCRAFHRDIPGFGARFEISSPLSPGWLAGSSINSHSVREFIQRHEPCRDYVLIQPNDYDGIEHLYRSTQFRVIALLREGPENAQPCFFAIRPAW